MEQKITPAPSASQKTLTLAAHAKINLFLDVVGRRADGYHDIESVMQTVSLADTVTVSVSDGRGEPAISLTVSDPRIPSDGRNLAWRAAEKIISVSGVRDSISINIEKRIPAAGGLAGGSTDAAAVFSALNALYGSPIESDTLIRIGAELGADIPFCLVGGTVETLGIGERLTPLSPIPDCDILIVRPHETVSTAEAYGKIDALPALPPHPSLSDMKDAIASGRLDDIARAAYNIFEKTMSPDSEIHMIKRALDERGAAMSMMSGSGATVFGIFSDRDDADAASDALLKLGYESVCARPVNASPVII